MHINLSIKQRAFEPDPQKHSEIAENSGGSKCAHKFVDQTGRLQKASEAPGRLWKALRRLQKASEVSRRPQTALESPRRLRNAPEGPRRLCSSRSRQKALEGPRRLWKAPVPEGFLCTCLLFSLRSLPFRPRTEIPRRFFMYVPFADPQLFPLIPCCTNIILT